MKNKRKKLRCGGRFLNWKKKKGVCDSIIDPRFILIFQALTKTSFGMQMVNWSIDNLSKNTKKRKHSMMSYGKIMVNIQIVMPICLSVCLPIYLSTHSCHRPLLVFNQFQLLIVIDVVVVLFPKAICGRQFI